jgi:hypothetical protein
MMIMIFTSHHLDLYSTLSYFPPLMKTDLDSIRIIVFDLIAIIYKPLLFEIKIYLLRYIYE